MAEIKKVVKEIYSFDLSKCECEDGTELLESDFVNNFKKRDIDRGVIVTPSGYKQGFVFKNTNNGEIYNNPSWMPDVINFSLDIYGLKKNAFYNVTVIGKNTRAYNSVRDATDDRSIIVTTQEREEIIKYDFSADGDYTSVSGIFRATGNERSVFFRVGKIYISNIIINEVELSIDTEEDEKEEEERTSDAMLDDKISSVAYGIFTTQSAKVDTFGYTGRYLPMVRLSGKGLNLYFDREENTYTLERDNIEDVIGEPFTNLNYIIDINTNKIVNKGLFSQYNITEISSDVSPNTLKNGFLRIEFIDDNGNRVKYNNDSNRLFIIIRKIF